MSASMRLVTGIAFTQRRMPMHKKLHNFARIETRPIPELQMQATLWRHGPTNLEHLHLEREDSNNLFAIGFRTPPLDLTGTPHILEHTTLCGSKQYPVRDPFFKMLNRSLASYMNAFTATDYTVYPFSTTNAQDYNNLQAVYLDATLCPLLKESDFSQEGWRLEHKDVHDPESPLQLKGVVYNEMKGQMSEASYVFYILYQRAMFPNTLYANDSGGDPAYIPNLDHDQLIRYHQAHYHPSNAKVFTYGSGNVHDIHSVINSKLAEFTRKDNISVCQTPSTVEGTRYVTMMGPKDTLAPDDRQFKSSLSFQCASLDDVYELFKLKILSSLLLDGHGAPLYQALIASGLASDYSPNTGLDTSTIRSVLSIGVQGATQNACDDLEQIVLRSLQETKKQGFPSARIAGLMHQLELALKRPSSSFGLNLLTGISASWFNGINPLSLLSYQEYIERFKEELSLSRPLELLMDKYLLDLKASRLIFTLTPNADFVSQAHRQEQNILAGKIANLTTDERAAIYEKGQALEKSQQSNEDLSSLPSLKVSDIPLCKTSTKIERSQIGGMQASWHFHDSGLTYVRYFFDTSALPAELHIYMPLFADCFTHLGTSSHSIIEIEEKLKLKTGGLSVVPKITTDPNDQSITRSGLLFSTLCLDVNIPDMVQVLSSIILETNFANVTQLKTLIRTNASALSDNVSEAGHQFAMLGSSSRLTSSCHLSNVYQGMPQINQLRAFANHTDLRELVKKLQDIHTFVMHSAQVKYFITTSEDNRDSIQQKLTDFSLKLQNSSIHNASQHNLTTSKFSIATLPSQRWHEFPFGVNHTALSIVGVPYNHKDGPALQVLAKLLTNKYLHTELREKGGAYGAGARYSTVAGIFQMYTYRDPSSTESIQAMLTACEWAGRNQWTDSDLEQAKLSIFQSVDMPTTIATEGIVEFVDCITPTMQQTRRERLLSVDADDVRAVASKYLTGAARSKQFAADIIGDGRDLSDRPEWAREGSGDFKICSEAAEVETVRTDTVKDNYDQIIRNPRYSDSGQLLSVKISDRAIRQLNSIAQQTSAQKQYLRVALESGGCHGYQYALTLTAELDAEEDVVFEVAQTPVVVDEVSLRLIEGSEVDYTMELIGSEFKVINNPRAISKCGCDTSIDIDIGMKG